MSTVALAKAAREASRVVQAVPSGERQAGLCRMAAALLSRGDEILAANAQDQEAAGHAVMAGEMSAAMAARLKLSTGRLEVLAEGMRKMAEQADPLGRILRRTEVAPGLVLTQETVALGVVLVIFESRPDVLPQLASLALASGNGLLLKGGKEARMSNRALHRVLTEALAPDLPAALFGLVETREEVGELLGLDAWIDLVIPRGSNQLVRSIQENTRIPVLGHADGICHVYVDKDADPAMAHRVVLDAKTDYPAACNAMETLLVHREYAGLTDLLGLLRGQDVRLFGGPEAVECCGLEPAESLAVEYGDLAATVEIVDGLEEAIAHIHAHGSGHTDCIVTETSACAERFLRQVDSACVFHNASTRFADGYRFGLGAEVGISTARVHARGPVGVDGLLTTRWRLEGDGHTVAAFSRGEERYTHRALAIDE